MSNKSNYLRGGVKKWITTLLLAGTLSGILASDVPKLGGPTSTGVVDQDDSQFGNLPVPNNVSTLFESGQISSLERDILILAFSNDFSKNPSITRGHISIVLNDILVVYVDGQKCTDGSKFYIGALANMIPEKGFPTDSPVLGG